LRHVALSAPVANGVNPQHPLGQKSLLSLDHGQNHGIWNTGTFKLFQGLWERVEVTWTGFYFSDNDLSRQTLKYRHNIAIREP